MFPLDNLLGTGCSSYQTVLGHSAESYKFSNQIPPIPIHADFVCSFTFLLSFSCVVLFLFINNNNNNNKVAWSFEPEPIARYRSTRYGRIPPGGTNCSTITSYGTVSSTKTAHRNAVLERKFCTRGFLQLPATPQKATNSCTTGRTVCWTSSFAGPPFCAMGPTVPEETIYGNGRTLLVNIICGFLCKKLKTSAHTMGVVRPALHTHTKQAHKKAPER